MPDTRENRIEFIMDYTDCSREMAELLFAEYYPSGLDT